MCDRCVCVCVWHVCVCRVCALCVCIVCVYVKENEED